MADLWDLERIGGTIVTVAAIAGAVVGLFRYGRKFWAAAKNIAIFTVYRRLRELEEKMTGIRAHMETLTAGMENLQRQVALILDEVQSNGAGQTLRKQLMREIEARWRDYEVQGRAVWQTSLQKNGEFGCARATDELIRLVGGAPYGSAWMQHLHPEDREELETAWNAAIERGAVYDELQRFVHRDNKGRPTHVVYGRAFFLPEFDDDGAFTGGIGQLFELSEAEYLDRLAGKEALDRTAG